MKPFILLVLFLVVYTYRIASTVDYPVYDETYLMQRGMWLAQGHIADSGVIDPSSGSLMVMLYAGWYSAIRSADIFVPAFVTALVLMTFACYVLVRRFLSVPMSLVSTMIIVICAVPACFPNTRYILGAGVLWLGLALINDKALWRGIGLLLLILSLYVRPEFMFVLLPVLAYLVYYEVWHKSKPLFTFMCYLPALILLVWTVNIMRLTSPDGSARSANAIPWSYTAYIHTNDIDSQSAARDLANPYVLYQRDFGELSQRSVGAELAAATHNLPAFANYLLFEARIALTVYASTFDPVNWQRPYLSTKPITLSVVGAIIFLVIIGLLLKSRPRFPVLRLSVVILLSLLGLVPMLILSTPEQRVWMTLPLVLVGVGAALDKLTWSRWILVLVMATFVLLPHPFDTPVHNDVKQTVALIEAQLPANSIFIAQAGATYANLAALDGYHFTGLDAEKYAQMPDNVNYILLGNSVRLVASSGAFSVVPVQLVAR